MADPKIPGKIPTAAERMIREVGGAQERIARGRARKNENWRSIAILGIVGWSVTIPTLLGIVAGVWMDRRWPGSVSWTLTLLVAGLALGCVTAWLRIEKEQQ